jgi:hypothetical protein
MAKLTLAVAVLVLMVGGAAAQVPSETATAACPITDFTKGDWNISKAACGECCRVYSRVDSMQLPRRCSMLLIGALSHSQQRA